LTNLSTLALPARKRGATIQPLEVALVPMALLTMHTAGAISGLSQATLYRKAATDPTFPRLIRLGKRCTRVRAGELTAWLSAQGGA
jgi:predicted DNA-binding transcriptional regulator AlpA